MHDLVELTRRLEVATERLLDDDARVLRAARRAEVLDHDSEQRRRDREVVRGATGVAELLLQLAEGTERRVVAVDVVERGRELLERGFVVDPSAVLLDAR